MLLLFSLVGTMPCPIFRIEEFFVTSSAEICQSMIHPLSESAMAWWSYGI